MTDWRQSTWGDEISLEYGKGVRGHDQPSGRYRVFGSNGPIGWTDSALAPGPGVILGRKGAYRGVQFSKEPFFVIDTAYYVKPKSELDMRWLYYAMIFHKLGMIDDGSPIPSTTRAAVYVRELDVPELDEQIAISSLLGALDDKIELNRLMNETLEQMAQAIFKDWFVDFGPVRRRQEGVSDPIVIMGGLVQNPARASELATLFPDALGDDGLPEGWAKQAIGSLVETVGGATPSTSDPSLWEPAEHFWATPKDLATKSDPVLFDTERRISAAGLARISSGLLLVGTVLLSSRAPIGYLTIARVPVAINQGFIALKPSGVFGSAFLYLWCKANMDQIVANANGSTFQEISKKNFRPIASALPTDARLLQEMDAIVGPIFQRLAAAAAESQTLSETRDYLLPKLMSGEVRVREAEKIAEDAL